MITLNVIGLDETIAKLDKLANQDLKQELASIVESGAKEYVRLAQKDAPVRRTPITKTGGTYGSNLKQEITYYPQGGTDLSRTVTSPNIASPYMEWGTITFVRVPAELSEYAAQFKGKGIRKNGGIVPRPFFFKQAPLVEKYLTERIEAFLKGIEL